MAQLTPYDQARLWTGLQRIALDPGRCQVLSYDKENLRYWPGADMHPVPSLHICIEGEVRLRIREKDMITLSTGQSLILAPGVCHEHVPLRKDSVCYEQGFLSNFSDYEFFTTQSYAIGSVPQQPYRGYCDQLLLADVDARPSIIGELLQALIGERRHMHREQSPALRKMIHYMIKYAHRPIHAKDIIAASGLQHAQAYQLCADFYGEPLYQVLQQRRVHIATAHMHSGMDIAETAVASGFRSQRSMCSAFKKYFQQTPMAWCREHLL